MALLFIIKYILNIKVIVSAIVTENHKPVIPFIIIGNIYIIAICKIKVLVKEIIAEILPLFKAVKNDEVKILNPRIKYESE